MKWGIAMKQPGGAGGKLYTRVFGGKDEVEDDVSCCQLSLAPNLFPGKE